MVACRRGPRGEHESLRAGGTARELCCRRAPAAYLHRLGKPAVDDTNIVVHFRRSDVLATGGMFRLDGYPVIDLENGGSIQGVLEALNSFVDLAVTDTLGEGGTMIVPGHGRICDEADLARYRDTLTIIRDRVAALKQQGRTLTQIKAARPTLDYDSRFGRNPDWTDEDFIEAVYASLGT